MSSHVKGSQYTQSFLLLASLTVIILIVSPLIGGISFNGIESLWLITFIMIIATTCGNILYFKGMETSDASTSQIAFSSILIWGTFLSVAFLGSNFTSKQSIGILVLFIAILFVQYSKKSLKINRGFLYIIASAALFAVFQVTSAEISQTMSAGGYLLLAHLMPALLIGVIYANKIRSDMRVLKNKILPTAKPVLFSCAASFFYIYFSYLAYKNSPDPGIVVVLLTSQVLLAVILGIIFLKERDRMGRKILAVILAVIAGILIKG